MWVGGIEMKIEEAIKELDKTKKNFKQSYDLIINLKNIDLKKPENRISKEIILPYEKGRPASVCVLSENFGINKEEIERIANSKRDIKKFVKRYEFFLASPDLMPFIGKTLGKYLAPQGKMPQPLPPNLSKEQINNLIKTKERSVRVRLKSSLNIQVMVGKEGMKNEEIVENIKTVLKEITAMLPKARAQIKDVLLKKTMSKPIKIEF